MHLLSAVYASAAVRNFRDGISNRRRASLSRSDPSFTGKGSEVAKSLKAPQR